ncbi:MAG: hypothetical protein IJU76_09570 [Desulfovibrionaceae bacterium]|nr:hypothetical protein [Desulfovibrionaceae bacterium]
MNARKIREDLGRVKTSCQRRDLKTALLLLISSVKELNGQRFPTDMRTDFREALNAATADPQFKKIYTQPIIYKAGAEREIVILLARVYQTLIGKQSEETFEEAADRKLRIDSAIRDAKNYLARGQMREAEASFTEALKNYRDEHSIFLVIARLYMDCKEYGRALGYIREGLKKIPEDASLRELGETCLRLRGDAARA